MSLAPGTPLGIYEITGLLGAGGMGEVYRARDTKLGRDVAIKTLPATLAGDKDRLARFEREAKLLASLNHAHIAGVYGLDAQAGTLYIAMELVEGESLEEKLKAGPMAVESALGLALQIAEALEAAHAKGIVHRDLKPGNVMITPDGVVKVLDFGLAKAFSGDPFEASPAHSPALSLAMTQAGLVLGTAGYMSPEQASGQATDQRSDVWAFGVVLYEMLTGLPLFGGESVPHILADVLRAEPDWSRLPKGLHPRIRELLERCLEKRPRYRYAGIGDARTDIEVALKDPEGVSARREQRAGGAAAVPLHRRLLPWAAGIALAGLAGVAAWTLKTPPAPPVIRTTETLPDGQSFLFPQAQALDISPDGRRFVMNTQSGLALRSIDSFEATFVPGTAFQRAAPEFSPDGQSLAFIMGTSQNRIQLARMPVTGGSPRPLGLVGTLGQVAPAFDWGPDDTIVYGLADGVWRVSANGGAPERIIETGAGQQAAQPSLLPGGDWVLFSLGPAGTTAVDWDTAEIVAQSLSSGERRVLYSGGSSARYVPTGHVIYAFGSTLYALPFDIDAIEVTGGPVPVVDGVRRDSGSGLAQYAFSANGTLIYVPGEAVESGGGQLVVIDRDANVKSLPVPAGAYADLRVSPDGSAVAYTVTYADGDDIAVYALDDGTAPRRLTFGGTSRFPVWSHDGAHVAFQSRRDGTASLYWQLADGTGGDPVRLTTAAEGETHTADSFSPDGERLTFTLAAATGETSVWVLELATGETKALIAEPGAAQSVFSPDGRWIAYQSTETGAAEVFVQPFPLTGAKFQLPQALTNHHPAWSADGRELFYFPGIGSFAAVRITTEPRFSFGAPEMLTNNPLNAAPNTRRQFDVMPDGSGFIGASLGAAVYGETDTVRIVYNWFDELARLAPASR